MDGTKSKYRCIFYAIEFILVIILFNAVKERTSEQTIHGTTRGIGSIHSDGVITENADMLNPPPVPNVFYYIWCQKKIFTFQDYLGIISVIRFMAPDRIFFYYKLFPEQDRKYIYNTWFEELRSTYPHLALIRITNKDMCERSHPTIHVILELLGTSGGVYLTTSVILTARLDMSSSFKMQWDMRTAKGFVVVAPGVTNTIKMKNIDFDAIEKCSDIHLNQTAKDSPLFIARTDIELMRNSVCFVVDGPFFPRDIWAREDYFGVITRTLFYGKPDIRTPMKNPSIVVPNIGHMIWVGGGEMNFLFYLSVLSLIHIQNVERVYIHGDLPPSGANWEKVKHLPQVTFKYRHSEGMQIFGTWVGDFARFWQVAHWSDVIRTDIMLKWGGIYIDTDAIFVKKLDDELRRYDAVSHYSFAYRDPYPDSFVNGFMLAKPGAEFFVRFLDSMKHYLDSNWMYNGLLAPYKIMERYPYLVHIEPHIEVVCLIMKCHPTWVPYYHNMYKNHLNSNSLPDWKNDANVYHFCSDGCPNELKNETALREAPVDSMFAQMGRLILGAAGLLDTYIDSEQ